MCMQPWLAADASRRRIQSSLDHCGRLAGRGTCKSTHQIPQRARYVRRWLAGNSSNSPTALNYFPWLRRLRKLDRLAGRVLFAINRPLWDAWKEFRFYSSQVDKMVMIGAIKRYVCDGWQLDTITIRYINSAASLFLSLLLPVFLRINSIRAENGSGQSRKFPLHECA